MRRPDFTPLLLLLPIFIALLPGGLPNTADMPVHFIRAAEMVHAWRDGVLLPRWSANLGFGYGIPLFNYAPPLPYFLTAFLNLLGIPLEVALKGTLVIALLVAAWGCYVLLQDSFGALAGAVGTAAFLYAPYRLRELFIQGNLGQLLAWSFVPWAFWGLNRLWATGRARYGVVAALALTGALLSHNVVALMLGALMGAQTVGLAFRALRVRPDTDARAAFRRLAQTAFVAVGGLALAAWFSLPALLEGGYIQLDKIVASDYRTRFVPLAELVALSPPLDRSAVNPYLPLTLGAGQVALALAALPALWFAPRRAAAWGYDLLALFGAFMAHRLSLPLWESLPFLELFEFPARWHGFTALGLAGLMGAGIHLLAERAPRAGKVVAAGALLLLLTSALVNLYPHRLPPDTFNGAPADVVQFEIETGAVGTTSLAEFNPIWRALPLTDSPLVADYRAGRLPERVANESLPPGASAQTVASRVESHTLAVTLPEPAMVTLNLLYFPGWTATVNGEPASLTPEPATGLAQLALPAGAHDITLLFGDTPLRQGSEWLSLGAWLLLVLWGGRALVRARAAWGWAAPTFANGRVVVTALLPVLLLYFSASAWFAPASPPDSALPARTSLRADWGQELRLLGADLPPDLLRAGETVSVTAYVRALRPLESDYAVYLHLDDPTGQTVATSDQRHPAEIPTSNLPPAAYVRIPFVVTLPADLPPMRYTWRLGWHNPDRAAPLPTADGQQDTPLADLWIQSDTPSVTGAGAAFGGALHLRGATLNRDAHTLTLTWERTAALEGEYTIFVHLRDANGQTIAQADGDPFANRYRPADWRLNTPFAETRPLPEGVEYATIAIGFYHRESGARLPAFQGEDRLPDDALLLP